MSRQACTLASFCIAVAAALAPVGVRADRLTQTVSLPDTPTDFDSRGANSSVSPLVFQQFDDQNKTLQLDAVDLSFNASIRNTFRMKFTAPATITDSVATGDPNTPGPSITVYQPDGVHSLLTVKAPNDPSFLTRSVTFSNKPGESLTPSFGPDQPPPYYLAPAVTQASNSLHLTSPADLALFNGSKSIALPLEAHAFANNIVPQGFGAVSTNVSADVTVTYEYSKVASVPSPELGHGTVPEPASVILWGIGGATLLVAHRVRRRAA